MFKNFLNQLRQAMREGDYGRFAALILLAVIACVLFSFLCWKALDLLITHFNTLATYFGLPILLVVWWVYYCKKHPTQVGGPLPPPTMSDYFAV